MKIFDPVSIVLTINRCDSCSFVSIRNTSLSQVASDYYCNHPMEPDKKIASYIEWRSELPPIPSWCPFRQEKIELKIVENNDPAVDLDL